LADIARLLIQQVIDSADNEYEKVLAVREIFTTDVTDLNYRAWRWIEGYYERHQAAPTATAFRKNFPADVFKFVKGDNTPLAALVEEAGKDILAVELFKVLNQTLDLHDRGEYEQAAAALIRWSERGANLPAGDGFPAQLDATELHTLPDPEPLIEGILDVNTVSVLGGFSGSGKSFIAADWAMCIASGRPWLDHEVKQGKVLYIAAEGAFGMKTRVGAWQQRFDTALESGALTFLMAPVQFANAPHVARLSALLRDDEYDFVIIDTQARSTVGLEENSATDMGKFIDALYRMRDESKTTVLVIHHTGYDKSRTRGSSANFAAVDAEYIASTEDGPHTDITLKCSKRKDARQMDDMELKLEDVILGVKSSSCVIVRADASPVQDSGYEFIMLKYIRENEGCSTLDILNHIKKFSFTPDVTTLRRRLEALHELGKVENTPSTRKTEAKHWFVPADARTHTNSARTSGSSGAAPPSGPPRRGRGARTSVSGSLLARANIRKIKKVRR